MSDHEARVRAVYDHDEDKPRPSVRRRRQVADWGVDEEIFDHMPGRRFERRPAGHHESVPRGGADDGRRTIVIEPADGDLADEASYGGPGGEEYTSREDALRAHEEQKESVRAQESEELWGGDELFAEPDEEPSAAGELAARAEAFDQAYGSTEVDEAGALVSARADAVVRGGQAGRRTVKIGGRPGELQASPVRRRPPRTASERLGARPDRVAAWAFVLGLLLILIAVATANAAVPI
jgi:hypothetical protein